MQIGNGSRILIAQVLVDQVGCSLYSLPINAIMIEQFENCNLGVKISRVLIHQSVLSSLYVYPCHYPRRTTPKYPSQDPHKGGLYMYPRRTTPKTPTRGVSTFLCHFVRCGRDFIGPHNHTL